MKLFCCFTPAHEILFSQYFQPSVPEGFEIVAHRVEVAGAGDFLSPEFLACIRRKIDLVIQSLEENSGKSLIWSDVDIVFLDTSSQELEETLLHSGKQILFQREGLQTEEVNTGFILCRACPEVAAFFSLIRERLLAEPHKNEQIIANEILAGKTSSIDWGYLPYSYYARTHGWPPADAIKIYHANYTLGKDGIGQKIKQFKELRLLRKYGLPAKLLLSLPKIPRKIARVLRGS